MSVSPLVLRYTELFTSVSSVLVTHNLGYKPLVAVQWDDGGVGDYRLLGAKIQHNSSNAFTVDFGNYTFSGRITYV